MTHDRTRQRCTAPARALCAALILAATAGGPRSAATAADPVAPAPSRADRPNFVLLVLDDLGFGDLGCYGGEIRTPNIDSLAKQGLRFRRFYNSSRCCPTRASLMTGVYPQQAGITAMGQDLGRNVATIGEHLRAAGYGTAMTGKWHLSSTRPIGGANDSPAQLAWLNHQGDRDRPFADPATYPINRGFDRHYGPIWGVVNFFDPFSLVDGVRAVTEVPEDYYITDAINARSVDYIRQFGRDDRPFFLYIAETAPHWPVQARPEDIARYKGRYDKGWHAIRDERYQRQVELGLIDPKTAPLPKLMGRGPDWDALSPERRRYEAELMEVHAAMVDRVDQGVGQIIQALKDANRFDNTVFLVMSDNGASPERYLDYGFDRPSETREGAKIKYRGTFKPGAEDAWGYIGSWWANALNTPYRYWKAESFEGGCHSPMIVHHPAGLKTAPGGFTTEAGHVIDILPTFLEMAGATALTQLDGRALQPIEGKSLAPIFRKEPWSGHDALFFEHEGGRAMIAIDGYKIVAQGDQPWELYHLAHDATETRNLADAEPDRVRRMSAAWVAWAGRVGAPVPGSLRSAAVAPAPTAGAAPLVLQAGVVLAGARAPGIANQPIRVEAVVRDAGKNGVIVSQGAQIQGWALLVRDGRPVFIVRRAGELHEVVGPSPLKADATTLTAELRGDGRMVLRVDGNEVAAGSALGLIAAQPNDPLIVGDDQMGAVGSYSTPNPFRGTIDRLTMGRPD